VANELAKGTSESKPEGRRGAGPFGMAWLLARSPAMLMIPGTSTVPHLEENVAAAEIQLSKHDLAELNRIGG
jgi:pyridoxine 4-dehydrogenase